MMKKYLGIFVFLILISWVLYLRLTHVSETNRIKKHSKIIFGVIRQNLPTGRNQSNYMEYDYLDDNIKYHGEILIKSSYAQSLIFIGKTFPVILNKKEPSESRMLIYPKDFEDFGYMFPDSLTWVKKYE